MSKDVDFTVGDLKFQLSSYRDNDKLFFGPEENFLTFNRLKSRGKRLVQFQFNEMLYKEEDQDTVEVANMKTDRESVLDYLNEVLPEHYSKDRTTLDFGILQVSTKENTYETRRFETTDENALKIYMDDQTSKLIFYKSITEFGIVYPNKIPSIKA